MSKFFVGQRVRIVERDSDFYGSEARIYEIAPGRSRRDGNYYERVHYCEVFGAGKQHPNGSWLGYFDYQIEPMSRRGNDDVVQKLSQIMDLYKQGEGVPA